MKLKQVFAAVVAIGFFLSSGAASAESSYVTGAVWQRSTENEKLAYVMGITNTVNAEYSVQAESGKPPNQEQSAVPKMYAALQGTKLSGIVDRVDSYFTSYPDQVGDTVLDVIWLIYVEKKW